MRRDFKIAIPELVLGANKIAISLLECSISSIWFGSKPVVPIKIGIFLDTASFKTFIEASGVEKSIMTSGLTVSGIVSDTSIPTSAVCKSSPISFCKYLLFGLQLPPTRLKLLSLMIRVERSLPTLPVMPEMNICFTLD